MRHMAGEPPASSRRQRAGGPTVSPMRQRAGEHPAAGEPQATQGGRAPGELQATTGGRVPGEPQCDNGRESTRRAPCDKGRARTRRSSTTASARGHQGRGEPCGARTARAACGGWAPARSRQREDRHRVHKNTEKHSSARRWGKSRVLVCWGGGQIHRRRRRTGPAVRRRGPARHAVRILASVSNTGFVAEWAGCFRGAVTPEPGRVAADWKSAVTTG